MMTMRIVKIHKNLGILILRRGTWSFLWCSTLRQQSTW